MQNFSKLLLLGLLVCLFHFAISDEGIEKQTKIQKKKTVRIKDVLKVMKKAFSQIEERLTDIEEYVVTEIEELKKRANTQDLQMGKMDRMIAINSNIKVKNGKGCGCITVANGKYYVATVSHMIIKNVSSGKRCIKKNQKKDKFAVLSPDSSTTIKIDLENTIFFEKRVKINGKNERILADMVLIPISQHDLSLLNINTTLTRKLSSTRLVLFDHLQGISARNKGLVALSGKVLEEKQFPYFLTDSGGTKGFSGTCFYSNGALSALHVGDGNFAHYQSFKTDLDYLDDLERIQNMFRSSKKYFKLLSRNPRSKVIDTSLFYNKSYSKITFKELVKKRKLKQCK